MSRMKDMTTYWKMGLLACTIIFVMIPLTGAEEWDTEEEAKCAGTKSTISTTCTVVGSVGSFIPIIGDVISAAWDACGALTDELMDCENISGRLAALQEDVTKILETVGSINEKVDDLKATIEVQTYIERFKIIDMARTLMDVTLEYNRLLTGTENGAIVVANNAPAKDWIDEVLKDVSQVNTDLALMLNGIDIVIDGNNFNIYEVARKYKVCNFELYAYVTGVIIQASTLLLIATRLAPDRELREVDFFDAAAMLDFNTYQYRKACSFRDLPNEKTSFNFDEKPLQMVAKSLTTNTYFQNEIALHLFDNSKKYIGEFSIFSPANKYAGTKPHFFLEKCGAYGDNLRGYSSHVSWEELPKDYRERIWTIQFNDDHLLIHCGGKRIWYIKLEGSCRTRYGGKVKYIKPDWGQEPMVYNAEFPIASSDVLNYYEDKTWAMRYEDWTPVKGYQHYPWFIDQHPISVKTRDGIASGNKYIKMFFRRMIKKGSKDDKGNPIQDKIEGCEHYTMSYFDVAPHMHCDDKTYLSPAECEVYSELLADDPNNPLAGEIKNRCYNNAGLKDWFNIMKFYCRRTCDTETWANVEVFTGPNPKYSIRGCKSNVPFTAANVRRAKKKNGDNIWTFELDPIDQAFLRIKYRGVDMVKFDFAKDADNAEECIKYWTVPKDMGEMYMASNLGDVKIKHEYNSVYSQFKGQYQEDRDAFCGDAPSSGHWCNN